MTIRDQAVVICTRGNATFCWVALGYSVNCSRHSHQQRLEHMYMHMRAYILYTQNMTGTRSKSNNSFKSNSII